MSRLFKTYANKNGKYDIYCGDLIKEGPLNQIYALFFEIKKNDVNLFSAYISITDQLVHILRGYKIEEAKSAKEILDTFGYLKILTNIENKNNSDITHQFISKNCPGNLEITRQKLENELEWSKIELVKDTRNKYIIFKGRRHYIPNPITRNALGYKENQFIPKTDTEINAYPSGDNIDSVQDARLVRNIDNSDPVYVVFNVPVYERRHVPSQQTLQAIGEGQDKVETISTEEMNNIPEGKPLEEVRFWDIKQEKKKVIVPVKKWWQNEFWQIVGIVSAIVGIIGFLIFIAGLL